MPKLVIKNSTSLSAKETFSKMSHLFENDKDLRKLDPNYACNFDESKLCGTAKGSLFSASLQITDTDAGSELSLTVDLPFHLAMVKGMVEKTLKKKISEILS